MRAAGGYAGRVRILFLAAVWVALCGCGSSPHPAARQAPPPDPTTEDWFLRDAKELADLAAQAVRAERAGKADEAAAAIERAQPIQNRLLAVPRPGLAVLQAASDLDHLYGMALLKKGHHGWARLLFQKNQVRWKTWQPQTEDSERRLREARAAIAECDRRLGL